MKNFELYGLRGTLNDVAKISASSKFGYALNKNRNTIHSYLKGLDKRTQHTDFPKFDKKRLELCDKHCARDEENSPIFEDNKYTGLRDNEEFNNEMDALKVEFADVITHGEEADKTFNESMQEESSCRIHQVGREDVPNGLTPDQLDVIGSAMVVDYESDVEAEDE